MDIETDFSDSSSDSGSSSSDSDPDFNPQEGSSQGSSQEQVDIAYKRRCVDYWKEIEGTERYGKVQGRRSFSSVQNRFTRCSSMRTLRNWETQITRGGSKRAKMKELSDHVWERFVRVRDGNNPVHDDDIAQWAQERATEIEVPNFEINYSWVHRFKQKHCIVRRRTTKTVSRNFRTDKASLERTAENFIKQFRLKYKNTSPSLIYNTDQSGFRKEIHLQSTLAIRGQKHVYGVASNMNALTHSYTIQPLISADGVIHSPMLIVLKESSTSQNITRGFGPDVWTKIQPLLQDYDNLYAWGSTSGKCTNPITRDWFENVFFPYNPDGSVLLADSFNCFNQRHQSANPIEYTFEQIPPKVTGLIQPLDSYFFRPYKSLVNRFCEKSHYINPDLPYHDRNEQMKLHSLCIWLFSSSKFTNLVKYSFSKCGYIDNDRYEFIVPKDYCFPVKYEPCQITENTIQCNENSFIRCSHCEKFICFQHFYINYHRKFCINQ